LYRIDGEKSTKIKGFPGLLLERNNKKMQKKKNISVLSAQKCAIILFTAKTIYVYG